MNTTAIQQPPTTTYLESQIAKIIEEALRVGTPTPDDIPTAAAQYAAQIKRLAATPGR